MKKINFKFTKKHIFLIVLLVILSIIYSIYNYLNTYYKADSSTFFYAEPPETITQTIDSSGNIIYKLNNTSSTVGFIFYPGGKVDEYAYNNLGIACANYNITTFIPAMPFHLAVFNPNAATNIINNHPEINTWFIGGHSLGGSMAALYTSKNEDIIKGLILLGSYSTEEIKNTKVLSIYGSKDQVLNMENYNTYKPNISYNLTEHIIEGGNHSQFGSYGLQKGDGIATKEAKFQILTTAQLIDIFIYNRQINY